MLLRVQKYNATFQYVPGKEHVLPDALSRISPCKGESIPGLNISVHEIQLHLNASPKRLSEIREATTQDSTLCALKDMISSGWPEFRADCPSHLVDFWNFRDELCVEDGLVLKGTRIIVPKSLQPDVLAQIHIAHQGIEKCGEEVSQ